MDGLTAAKEIRRLMPDNGPRIVAVTAFAWRATVRNVWKPAWMAISQSL